MLDASRSRSLLAVGLCCALAVGPLAGLMHHVVWCGTICCERHVEHAEHHAPAAVPGIHPWFGHPGGAGAPHEEGKCVVCHYLSQSPLPGGEADGLGVPLPARPLPGLAEQAVPERPAAAARARAPPTLS